MRFCDVVDLIAEERERQDAKWGSQRDLDSLYWLAILTEEVGEVAKAIMDTNPNPMYEAPTVERYKHLTEELVQVAAVAVCWLEARGAP